MNTLAITEDIDYLAAQSPTDINNTLAGMTALLNDTDSKVAAIENQKWHQRMVKTVTGKNKIAQEEIRQNHDKLNAYMVNVIKELFNRNCISMQVMQSLGTQLNELYAEHIQLKQMLGAFVMKLNQKIENVDNFHMLITEIEQGVYSDDKPIVSVCKVLSQVGLVVLDDSKKTDILKRSLIDANILNDNELPIVEYFNDIMSLHNDETGQVCLELGTIRKIDFMADIFLTIIESYNFLPNATKKMKNKNSVIESIASEKDLETSIELSISEIYDTFMENKIQVKDGLLAITDGNNSVKVVENNLSYDDIKEELITSNKEILEVTNTISGLIDNINDVYNLEYFNIKGNKNKAGDILGSSEDEIKKILTYVSLVNGVVDNLNAVITKNMAITGNMDGSDMKTIIDNTAKSILDDIEAIREKDIVNMFYKMSKTLYEGADSIFVGDLDVEIRKEKKQEKEQEEEIYSVFDIFSASVLKAPRDYAKDVLDEYEDNINLKLTVNVDSICYKVSGNEDVTLSNKEVIKLGGFYVKGSSLYLNGKKITRIAPTSYYVKKLIHILNNAYVFFICQDILGHINKIDLDKEISILNELINLK